MYEKIISVIACVILGSFMFWRVSKRDNQGVDELESRAGDTVGKLNDELRESSSRVQERLDRVAEAERELERDKQDAQSTIERAREARAKVQEWLDNNRND